MNKSLIIILIIAIVGVVGFLFVFQATNGFQFDKQASSQNQEEQSMAQQGELKIEDTQEGTGEAVKSGDTVVVHYKGMLTDGKQFDSSYDRGQPFETKIGVGSVIEGWDKGIVGMKKGGKRKLTIPSEMGYGEAGADIPPNSTLIFEVELVDIK